MLLFSPARARATQLLFARYFSEGRLPWAPAETSAPKWRRARDAARALHREANRALERRLAERLEAAGLRVARNVKPLGKGLPFLPGEIDVLAADPARRRLWLVEAKDAHVAFSAVEMSDETGDIHGQRWPHSGRGGSRDEASRLANKARVCQDRLADVLALLGTEPDGSAWTVHPIVVTPALTPAAFVDDPIVLFCTADQLTGVIAFGSLPHAGLVMLDPLDPDPGRE